MKKLYLIRHAETVSGSEKCEDKDRKLSPNGIYQSLQLGAHLKERGVRPDLILCSTALRTRETLDNLLNQLDANGCDIRHEDRLYLCGPNEMLNALYQIPDDKTSVMMVAHNPGVSELALALAKKGHEEKLQVLKNGAYPTAAMTAFDFDVDSWGLISDDTAWLVDFVIPKVQPVSQTGE